MHFIFGRFIRYAGKFTSKSDKNSNFNYNFILKKNKYFSLSIFSILHTHTVVIMSDKCQIDK